MKFSLVFTFTLLTLSLGAFASLENLHAATFCVDNNGDGPATPGNCPVDCAGQDGSCTLRDAVAAANANGGTDEVQIPSGTFTLSETNAAITVDTDMNIAGAGMTETIIQWDTATVNTDRERIFTVDDSTVTISDLTLQNGSTGNGGGAVQTINASNLTIRNTLFQNNESRDSDGGALDNDDSSSTTIENSIFQNNFSTASVPGNDADAGAINNDDGCEMLIRNSQIINNNAGDDAGGIDNDTNAVLVIESSTISGNTATNNGGGIVTEGELFLTDSTVSGNMALGDDADDEGQAGGILVEEQDGSGELFATNVTVSGNSATNMGGGILQEGCGPFTMLNNVTVTDNLADSDNNMTGEGGGIVLFFDFCNTGGPSTNFEVRNSLIAGNRGPATSVDCYTDNSFNSLGYNLIGNTGSMDECNGFTDGTMGDQVGSAGMPIDPVIDVLANNGGPTQTHLLLTGSPAIDMANPAGCEDALDAPLTRDQRGVTRPLDGLGDGTAVCDIGALEVSRTDLQLSKLADPGEVEAGNTLTYSITVLNNGPEVAPNTMITDTLPPQVTFVSASSQCTEAGGTITCDLGDINAGDQVQVNITVTASNVASVTEFTNTATVVFSGLDPTPENNTDSATVLVISGGGGGGFFVFGSGCQLQALGATKSSVPFYLIFLALVSLGWAWRRSLPKNP